MSERINYPTGSFTILDSQRASLIGLIPRLGYGRGYTSNEILEADRERIQSVMYELGYRNADVRVRQGVSLNGEDLIITFAVTEGIPTFIKEITIEGNNVFADSKLKAELPAIVGKEFSRARARNGVQKISAFYASEGYYDAKVNYSIIELPKTDEEESVKLFTTLSGKEKGLLSIR